MAAAREAFEPLGVEVREEPVNPEPTGCSNCQFHAYDAEGFVVDGGEIGALSSWVRQQYLEAAYVRPVAGRVAP